jgi:hypothetical protein
MDANMAWQRSFQDAGIDLATIDLIPLELAHVIVVMDLPATRHEVLELKRCAPQAKLLLLLIESPFERPHWFDRRNHTEFDVILTYNCKLVDGARYQHFLLPIGHNSGNVPGLSFSQRDNCVLLNTNHYVGFRAAARPWHWMWKYRNLRRGGWHFRLADVIRTERCTNYHGRRRVARAAERFSPGFLDVYGGNWDGRKHGWYYRFFPDPPYKAAKGVYRAEKLSLLSRYRFVLAYENYVSDEGYISEKLFDALYAGAVPVYLGEREITDYVDPDCFVDVRQFKNEIQLLKSLQGCSQEQWQRMRDAGKNYLQSAHIKAFQPRRYAEMLLQTVLSLSGPRPSEK